MSVRNPEANVWDVDDMIYTGAAALRRDAAAYQATSLAASADLAAGGNIHLIIPQSSKEDPMTMPTPGVQAAQPAQLPQPALAPQQPQAPITAAPQPPQLMQQPAVPPVPQAPVAAAPAPAPAPTDPVSAINALREEINQRFSALENTVAQLAMKPGDVDEERESLDEPDEADEDARSFKQQAEAASAVAA